MARFTLTYQRASTGADNAVILAGAQTPAPGAFCAEVRYPKLFRDCMLTLGGIVRANFEWNPEPLDQWLERVLDPVVAVHPDGVSFEGFSQDGSTLGWAHFTDEMFGVPEIRKAGCTSIDYSQRLEDYLKSLSYASKVQLRIGTSEGVALEDSGAGHAEKRIDLPDNWLRGFGELHAGLAQARHAIPLTRADLHNLLGFLKSRRDVKRAKRALIFELRPGERVRARFEPWDHVIRLQAPPPDVDEDEEIKVYGRRRLALIEPLVPLVEKATVYLIDSSRPTYWELEMKGARFTLALSAWTSRTFTQSIGETLLAARAAIDNATLRRAAAYLSEAELARPEQLAAALEIAPDEAAGLGLELCRQGMAVADPRLGALRWRPIAHFPFAELSAGGAAFTREENAERLLREGRLDVDSVADREGLITASGRCEGFTGLYELSLALNPDGSFASGQCECAWVRRNGLKSGPCKHLLALREHALAQRKKGV